MGFDARLKFCNRPYAHKEHRFGLLRLRKCHGVLVPIYWCQDATPHGPHEFTGRVALFRCLGYPFPHRSK